MFSWVWWSTHFFLLLETKILLHQVCWIAPKNVVSTFITSGGYYTSCWHGISYLFVRSSTSCLGQNLRSPGNKAKDWPWSINDRYRSGLGFSLLTFDWYVVLFIPHSSPGYSCRGSWVIRPDMELTSFSSWQESDCIHRLSVRFLCFAHNKNWLWDWDLLRLATPWWAEANVIGGFLFFFCEWISRSGRYAGTNYCATQRVPYASAIRE